jgi:hypothetical protein
MYKYDCLTDKIINDTNGTEVLFSTGKELKKVKSTGNNRHFMEMYNEWVENRKKYQDDYEWYNNMKATNGGHCPGQFNEKLAHSEKLIRDTPESIQEFSKTAFKNWPQHLSEKINIQNELEGFESDNGGGFDLDTNGKIASNMYLVVWRREENKVRIHSYVTIFERTAGRNCYFNPEFWSGKRGKIINDKKHFMFITIESTPGYKTFLLGNR